MRLKDIKGKNRQENTTKTKSTIILKAIQHKEDIGNEWGRSEKNLLN